MKRISLLLLAAVVFPVGCGAGPPEAGTAETAPAATQRGSSAQILPSGPFSLELVADFNIPTGSSFEGISAADFGGISGLFFDPDRMEIVAISDSRANNRYFTLAVQLDGDAISLTPISVTDLADASTPDASPPDASAPDASMPDASMPEHTERLAARRVFDPESIARAPNGNLFVSTEGIVAREPRIAPTIAEYQPDGKFVRFLPVPDKFVPEAAGPQTQGIADNLAFESLAVSPDGSRVFTATEAALVQDGTPPSVDEGSLARILEIGVEGDSADVVREYIYPVEPLTLPDDFEPVAGENGLVELLALSNTELLALERNFVRGGTAAAPRRRNLIRIFRVSLQDATDVAEIFSLTGSSGIVPAELVPAEKELLIDLDEITSGLSPEYPELDNFEGLCWGPMLPDGSPSLIVVSDNNFNPWQRTSFLLFRIRTE